MKNVKGFIVLAIAVLCGVGGILLRSTSMEKYSILAFTVAGVLLCVGVIMLIKNSSPNRIYESTVNGILNTYDSVLVKSTTPPSLDDRNIVMVTSIEDLIDAQMELRKPICYLKQTESCSFALLDDKEAYIYIEKLNEDVVSPLEIAIKECKIKNKNKEEMDSEMLRDIEKTTVVKLSNQKSYKVSPIRKKKKEEETAAETKTEEVENKNIEPASVEMPAAPVEVAPMPAPVEMPTPPIEVAPMPEPVAPMPEPVAPPAPEPIAAPAPVVTIEPTPEDKSDKPVIIEIREEEII